MAGSCRRFVVVGGALALLAASGAHAQVPAQPVPVAEAMRQSSEDPRRFLADSAAWIADPAQVADPDWLREILLRRGRAAWFLSDREVARESARALDQLAQRADMPTARAYALLLAADEAADLGRHESAIDHVTRAAGILRQTRDPRWRAIAQTELCDVYVGSERQDQAEVHCRRAHRHFTQSGEDWYLARIENLLVMLLEQEGRIDEALAMAASARTRFERLGMPSMVAMVDENTSSLYLARGDAAAALEISKRALALELGSGKLQHAVSSRVNIARALSALGRHAEARRAIDEAIAEAERLELAPMREWLHLSAMEVAEAAGDLGRALASAQTAIESGSALQEERTQRAIAEMEARFQAAEQAREIERLDQAQRIRDLELARSREENARQSEQLARQTLWLWLVTVATLGFVVVSGLMYALWRSSRRHGERLRQLADTDGLTGVLNRRAFVERMEAAWSAAGAASPAALALIDADHFKRINDTRGHGVGDRTLQLIARLLAEAAGRDGLVGRMGGEEFALLWPRTDVIEASERAQAARRAIATAHEDPAGLGFPVTVSIGVAMAPDAGLADAEAWLHAADRALYRAKGGGRNRVERHPEGSADTLAAPQARAARPQGAG